jgi:hypothetical protein
VWGEPIKEAPKTRRLAWAIGGVVGLVVLAVAIVLGILFFKPDTGASLAQNTIATVPSVIPSNEFASPETPVASLAPATAEPPTWAFVLEKSFPAEFWSVGSHTYSFAWTCPGEAPESVTRYFSVLNSFPVISDNVYLRWSALRVGNPWGEIVDGINPAQPTVAAVAWNNITKSEAEWRISNCTGTISWDGGASELLTGVSFEHAGDTPGTANNCAPQINSPSTQNLEPLALDTMQKLLDNAQVIYSNDFSNPLLPGWGVSGDIYHLYVKDHTIFFSDAQILRNYGLQVSEAARMLIRFNSDTHFTIQVWSKNYNDLNHRNWGLGLNPDVDSCDRLMDVFYEGANDSPDQITIWEAMGMMVPEPDVWYYVLLWVRGPSQFYVRIWEQDHPEVFADRQFDMIDSANWINRRWEPHIYVDDGNLSTNEALLEMKNYTELSMPNVP